jgi:hypothetical protein
VPFVERSLANNLAPNRDIGIQLFGDVAQGALSYALGVYNGVPDGGSGDADTNDDKDVVARVFAQPFRNRGGSALQGLGLGLAVTSGRQKEALSGVNLRTASRSSFFRYADGTTADGERTRLAPQFYFYNGPVGFLGEYITSRQRVRRGDVADTLTHNALTIQPKLLPQEAEGEHGEHHLQLEAPWRDRVDRASQSLRQLAESRLHPLTRQTTHVLQAAVQLLFHVRAARHHQIDPGLRTQRALKPDVQKTSVAKERAALG